MFFVGDITCHQLINFHFIYPMSICWAQIIIENNQGKHSRVKQVRNMLKQYDIMQKYLLHNFVNKLNHNDIGEINKCQLKIFLLTMFLRNKIVQEIFLRHINLFFFNFLFVLMIVHSMVKPHHLAHTNTLQLLCDNTHINMTPQGTCRLVPVTWLFF